MSETTAPVFAVNAKFDKDFSPAKCAKFLAISPGAAPLGDRADPVDFLLNMMDTEPDPDFSPEQRIYHDSMRLKAAIAAAPFLRPKLAQVEHRGGLTLTHEDALSELEGDS